MANPRNFLDMISDLMKTGPAQGALEYTAPSPAVSMVRRQFSNQNYPGSDPLFDKIQAQTRDMRATTDLTRGLQRDQIGEYFTGTPESFNLATAAKNNAAGLPAEMQAMQEGFYPASFFPTPAAPPPPLTVDQNVGNKVKAALTEGSRNGTDIGNADRGANMAKTLMGGDMGEFMQKLLRATLQPEFQQPGFGGLGQVMLGATNALRAVETQDAETAKLEAAANTEMLKAQTEMAKAQLEAGGWDAKSFQVEQLGNLTRSIEAAGTIDSMKELLSGGLISGGPAGALTALRGLGDLVGISLDPGMRQKYEDQVDQLATSLVSSGIFGREVNKSEWDTIFKLIAKPGINKGDPVLLGRLNSLLAKVNKSIQSDTRSLKMQGVPVQKLLEPSKPLFTRGN